MPAALTGALRQRLRARLSRLSVPVLSCLLTTGVIHAQIGVPELSVDNETATAGFYRLSWETSAEAVELQEAASPDFGQSTTAYSGPDRSTVISGKPDGTWYYRIRSLDNTRPVPWSDTVAVTVAHHSLSRALLFLALGFVVFVAIVFTIVRGGEST